MIKDLNHITLAVIDLERSFHFYRHVLDFKPLCRWQDGAYFLVGELWLCLNVDQKRMPSPCYTHYAFSVSSEEFAEMRQKIIRAGAIIFKENTTPGDSLYFLDPDGHKLEIHVGNWRMRLNAKKHDPGSWKNIEWFEL